MSRLAVPQHRQHVLLLALALPDHEVPRMCQQLSHLCPRDGSMVPQLLMQGLLHLWNELQRWGELDRDRGGARRGHSASPSAEVTRPASWGVSGSLSYTPCPHKARECHLQPLEPAINSPRLGDPKQSFCLFLQATAPNHSWSREPWGDEAAAPFHTRGWWRGRGYGGGTESQGRDGLPSKSGLGRASSRATLRLNPKHRGRRGLGGRP